MIIDEQPFFRAGVRQVLACEQDFEIFEANPDDNILKTVETSLPDIVLLGADLASQSGLGLSGKIARNFPTTKVIILSLNADDEEMFNAIRSSAVACLSKKTTSSDLTATIRRASKGEYPINDSIYSPTVARHVLHEFQDDASLGEDIIVPLTHREKQILTRIAEGNSNKKIAGILEISEQTIKNHVSAILRKLNANDRAHAVVLGLRLGYIRLNETK
jgi:two-component system, NarL family, response regulator DegU